MMVAIRNLLYHMVTGLQRVLNKDVMVTNGFWATLSIPYIVTRIIDDTGSYDGDKGKWVKGKAISWQSWTVSEGSRT
jgi:hypothetical protein